MEIRISRIVINNYLEKQDPDVDDKLFNFEKPIKNLADIEYRIDNYKPDKEIQYDKKRIVSILT